MTVSPEDAKKIIEAINRAYREAIRRTEVIPFPDPLGIRAQLRKAIIDALFPPYHPRVLSKIPECAKKYTVGEIIEMLENPYYIRMLEIPKEVY